MSQVILATAVSQAILVSLASVATVAFQVIAELELLVIPAIAEQEFQGSQVTAASQAILEFLVIVVIVVIVA